MVATTFAADTPLAVTGMVATGRHRRELAVVELCRQRHDDGLLLRAAVAPQRRDDRHRVLARSATPASPRPSCAASAPSTSAIPINCIILGWVNMAMVEILTLMLGVNKHPGPGHGACGLIALTSFISTLSGLWGVLVTDLFQFVIKMGMVIVLAVYAVRAVGGIDAMKQKLALAATRARGRPGLGPQFRPGSQFRLDAVDRLPRVHFPELVGHLVSRRGAGRRRLRGPAHVLRPATRSIRCWPRSGSTSRTTPSGPGPGSWWRSLR